MAAAFVAGDAPLARPVYSVGGAVVPGHPVFIARRVWEELYNLSGDQGARALLSSRPDWLLEVPVEGEPPADIDTWDDYRRAGGAAARR